MDRHAINKSGYNTIRVTEPDKCIACAQCATMCPDSVITVEVIDNA
jgi:2-oxoglutarate ferredoxin oxidoreductase subunit delta